MSTLSDIQAGSDIATAGVGLIAKIVELIIAATKGDKEAFASLKRVDAILSPISPTEAAFARAGDIAAGKPSSEP